jgi:hypothetical protein
VSKKTDQIRELHGRFGQSSESVSIGRMHRAVASSAANFTGQDGMTQETRRELEALARHIVGESTSPQAQGFDAIAWLDRWLETPQPALSGCTPMQAIDTPEGVLAVKNLMGAILSGVFVDVFCPPTSTIGVKPAEFD